VDAPAVALRLNLDDFDDRLKEEYSALDFDTDFHSFFNRVLGISPADDMDDGSYLENKKIMDVDTARYFFVEKTDILSRASPEQLNYIKSIYPGVE
jgi:hypothetical protein